MPIARKKGSEVAPLPAKRAIDAAPNAATRTMFFSNTTSDYAGAAVPQGAQTVNFAQLRDPHPPGGHGLAGRYWSGSMGVDASWKSATFGGGRRRPTTPPNIALTEYAQNCDQKTMMGTKLDREMALEIQQCAKGGGPMANAKGEFVSCYGALCHNRGPGIRERPWGATKADMEESQLKTILTPTVDEDANPKVSFAGTQHSMPAKELIFKNEAWLPMHNLGQVSSKASFLESEKQRQFRHKDVLRRSASAPDAQSSPKPADRSTTNKEELDRAFREAMMTSQYRFAHVGSSRPGPGRRKQGGR